MGDDVTDARGLARDVTDARGLVRDVTDGLAASARKFSSDSGQCRPLRAFPREKLVHVAATLETSASQYRGGVQTVQAGSPGGRGVKGSCPGAQSRAISPSCCFPADGDETAPIPAAPPASASDRLYALRHR